MATSLGTSETIDVMMKRVLDIQIENLADAKYAGGGAEARPKVDIDVSNVHEGGFVEIDKKAYLAAEWCKTLRRG